MMAPKFVKLFKEKDITNAQFYFVAGSFAAFVPALGITLGFALLGKFILHHLFGEQYVAAYLPTIIILASTAINAAGSLSSVVLMHNGFQKLVLRQTTWAIALGALVAVGAGHFLGEIGIALGTLVSSIVRDIGLSTMLFRHTGLRPGALSFSGWKMALQYGSKATKILTRRTGASS